MRGKYMSRGVGTVTVDHVAHRIVFKVKSGNFLWILDLALTYMNINDVTKRRHDDKVCNSS